MKKIMIVGILLVFVMLAVGCATPKLYVPESELPKTKFVVIETTTYEKFEVKDGEFVFINKTNEEYGRIFQDAFKEKLEEKGFVVLSIASGTKKDSNDFLLIKVSLSDKPPIIPLLTNGIVAFTAIIEKDGKILWRMDGGNFTDPPIIPVSWIVKKGTARVLTKAIMESFKVK